MAGRPVANLIIRDKRADGYVEKHAWGLDWPMSAVDQSRRVGITQNAARQMPEWKLTDAVPIPEIGAVILDADWGSSDMVLSAWMQESSSYWKLVQPPGWQMDWIKWYDGRANQSGSLLLKTMLSKNPSCGLTFLRAQPPAGQANAIYLALTLNGLGTIRYQLYIPQDGSSYPTLYKSEDMGSSWDVIDQFRNEEGLRWATEAFGKSEWIRWLWIPDHFIIQLGDASRRWIYFEDGLEVPQGHVRFECAGGQVAFHFDQLTYRSPGYIERQFYNVVPNLLNDEASDTTDHLGQTPDGTAISTQMIADANGVKPKATLTSDGICTPLLTEIQATRPAKHSTPVTTKLFDNVTESGDKTKIEEARFYVAKDWRGSWFEVDLYTTGEYDFDGNEKAQLSVALDTGGAPSYTTQVTGYLQTPARTLDGKQPGVIRLELRAQDRFCRLKNKAGLLLPSFAGWTFADAFTWLFHECAGIQESELSLDAGAADWVYPAPLTGLILKFDHTLRVDVIADELAKAAGRRWGINRLGQIFTEAWGTIVYDGVPEFTLDEDTATEADVAYYVQVKRDIFALRNHVLALGRDGEGNDVVASWRWTDSMSNPSADAFIGDEWSDVVLAPDGANPYMTAEFRGTELQNYQRLIIWETDAKPDLFPDHYVKVQVANLDIPTDTVFKIIEKYGVLKPETGEFITKFLGATL